MGGIIKTIREKMFPVGSPIDAFYGYGQSNFESLFTGDVDASRSSTEYLTRSDAVYAAVMLRARSLASLPLVGYRMVKGVPQRVDQSKLISLIERVNPFWDYQRLLMMTEISLCLRGEAVWIPQATRREIDELWFINSDRLDVKTHPTKYISHYEYQVSDRSIRFEQNELIHFIYPNPENEYRGLSPITAARMMIDTSFDAQRANRNIFRNGFAASAIISPKDGDAKMSVTQAQMLSQMIESRFVGVDKRHKIAVLNNPVSVEAISLTPKDAEYIEQNRLTIEAVARIFTVPPTMLQDFSRATYSNVESAHYAFWSECIIPEARFIASVINERFVPLFKNDVDWVEFDTSDVHVLQGDYKKRAEVDEIKARTVQTLIASGIDANEVLKMYIPELANSAVVITTDTAKIKTVSSGSIELDSTEHSNAIEAFENKIKAFERRSIRLIKKMMERQRKDIVAAIRASQQKDLTVYSIDREYWDNEFEDEITPFLSEVVISTGTSALVELGATIAFNVVSPSVQQFISSRAQRFAVQVNDTTWDEMRKEINLVYSEGLGVDALADRVYNRLGARINSSAETIARTELIGAMNGGAQLGAEQSGLDVKKAWLAARDERTRPTHITAHQTYQSNPIGLNENFIVGNGSGKCPGSIGLPEEDINCRCTMTWVIPGTDKMFSKTLELLRKFADAKD